MLVGTIRRIPGEGDCKSAEFLRTLTGKQPTVQLPHLPVETAATPHPEP
jgi:hypothetical protein